MKMLIKKAAVSAIAAAATLGGMNVALAACSDVRCTDIKITRIVVREAVI